MKRPDIPPAVLALSGAHMVSDIFSNIYAPLLPLFIPKLGLSLAGAGALAMAIQLSGSVAQLFFGPLADRWRPRVLAVAGPVVTVSCLGFAGWAVSPLMLGAILVLPALARWLYRSGPGTVPNQS